jgi:hypothetical protein
MRSNGRSRTIIPGQLGPTRLRIISTVPSLRIVGFQAVPSLVLGLQDIDDADHVMLGDALSDTDNEGDLGGDGLFY